MPLSRDQALAIARQRLADEGGNHILVILEDAIVERDFGWVFPSQTLAYRQTGDPNSLVPGIGPLVVLKEDGATEFIGTSGSPNAGIDIFEEKWREKQRGRA